jgi:hypothetical protein
MAEPFSAESRLILPATADLITDIDQALEVL